MQGSSTIHQKLQAYRDKRIRFRVLRGAIVTGLVFLCLVLLLVLGEGMLWMPVAARTAAVVLLLATLVILLAVWVIRPLLFRYGIGKQETDEELARSVGRYFPAVQDKLLNYLQLERTGQVQENSLLLAAIQQRTDELRPIPFVSAISFQPNWRLARWLLVPLAMLVLMAAVRPDWVVGSSNRLVRFREPFVPPPPFDIRILDHKPLLTAGTDHTIAVRVAGEALPEELYLYERRGATGVFHPMPLQRLEPGSYQYTFKSVQEDFAYYVGTGGYGTPQLDVQVRQRPSLRQFQTVVIPPPYTGLRRDTLPMNQGQFRAPVGSQVLLVLEPLFTVDSAWVEATPAVFRRQAAPQIRFGGRILADGDFRIRLLSAEGLRNVDTVRYQYQTILDRSPSVELTPPATPFLPPQGLVTLDALAQDDYGLVRAEVLYRVAESADPSRVKPEFSTQAIGISPGPSQRLTADVDFVGMDIRSGETVEYAVRVWDNDGVQGSKPGQSSLFRLSYASTNTLYESLAEQNQQVDESLDAALSRSEEVKKEIAALEKKMLAKREATAEDRRRLEQLLQEQQKVSQQLQQAGQQLNESKELNKENQLSQRDTEMRLEELQKMLGDVNQQELMEMLQEMQQTRTPDKSQMQSMLQQLQRQNRDTKADIERIKELFNQWKQRQKMDELSRKLQEQAMQQQELEQKTKSAKKDDSQQLAQEQKSLNDQAKDNNKLLDELQKLQEASKQKEEAKAKQEQAQQELQQRQQQVEKAQQQAQQQLQQNQPKQAAKQQRDALDKLQEQQQQLSQMRQQANQNEAQENYDDLRRLLDNLLKLSFDQETLRNQTAKLDEQDPALARTERRQSRLRDDMSMVRDSLEALAARAQEIKQQVLDETRNITEQMEYVRQGLDERQVGMASSYQHNVMTSLNNLANMLTESLQQMQNNLRMQMKGQQQQGQGQQQAPGQGLQDLIRQQRSLNEAMEELENLVRQKQAEEQAKGGSEGQGNKGVDGETQAKLTEQAEQQEAIRQKLQEAYERLKEGGTNPGTLGKAAEDMAETVEELKRLEVSRELRQRQQGILNRMLQYDNALRVKEREEQREAKRPTTSDGKNNPAAWQNPEAQERLFREQLQHNRSQFSPSYQKLIDEYLRRLPSRVDAQPQ